MFKPTEEKSAVTEALIGKIFTCFVPEEAFTVVYGYDVKHSLFGKRISIYVIGFNKITQETVIILISPEGEVIKNIKLKKNEIKSVRLVFQRHIIKTTQGTFSVVVPAYTPTTLESLGVLPLVQEENAEEFKNYMMSF